MNTSTIGVWVERTKFDAYRSLLLPFLMDFAWRVECEWLPEQQKSLWKLISGICCSHQRPQYDSVRNISKAILKVLEFLGNFIRLLLSRAHRQRQYKLHYDRIMETVRRQQSFSFTIYFFVTKWKIAHRIIFDDEQRRQINPNFSMFSLHCNSDKQIIKIQNAFETHLTFSWAHSPNRLINQHEKLNSGKMLFTRALWQSNCISMCALVWIFGMHLKFQRPITYANMKLVACTHKWFVLCVLLWCEWHDNWYSTLWSQQSTWHNFGCVTCPIIGMFWTIRTIETHFFFFSASESYSQVFTSVL